ncbi:hypothetical protein BDD12DRAFT_983137 [Trichophaea hybrida]|nr:hypothetical protein BDD12DRAFT_983137 [Trichophaea hybrida]
MSTTADLDTYIRSIAATIATHPSSKTPHQFIGQKALTHRFYGTVPNELVLSSGEKFTRAQIVARLGEMLGITQGLAWELNLKAREGGLEELMLEEHRVGGMMGGDVKNTGEDADAGEKIKRNADTTMEKSNKRVIAMVRAVEEVAKEGGLVGKARVMEEKVLFEKDGPIKVANFPAKHGETGGAARIVFGGSIPNRKHGEAGSAERIVFGGGSCGRRDGGDDDWELPTPTSAKYSLLLRDPPTKLARSFSLSSPTIPPQTPPSTWGGAPKPARSFSVSSPTIPPPTPPSGWSGALKSARSSSLSSPTIPPRTSPSGLSGAPKRPTLPTSWTTPSKSSAPQPFSTLSPPTSPSLPGCTWTTSPSFSSSTWKKSLQPPIALSIPSISPPSRSPPPPPPPPSPSPIPYPLQHCILPPLQTVLESTCHAYLSHHAPHILTQENWPTPQSAELHLYIPKILSTIPQDQQHTIPSKKLIEIRHIAVHRIPVRAGTVFSLLNAAVVAARILGDDKSAERILRLQGLVGKEVEGRREVESVAERVRERMEYLEGVKREVEGEMERLESVVERLVGRGKGRNVAGFRKKVEEALFVQEEEGEEGCGGEELEEIRKRLKEGFRWMGGEGVDTVDCEDRTTIEDIMVEDDTTVVDEEIYTPTSRW